ncbi:DUF3006 domain-containing protein [Natronobiforma cellulositropha]|uniref:DUF3006 domain-containing protein n=1 Tax=Natronobiforma cellulositropha TaxID=1679076 RepID=UPI0021D5A027|nr:DUF3006 domain-containing protein [Natronobiforma cellulositropha]
MSETYTATLDRIVDGEWAVLLLEDEGETVDQLDVPLERLPAEGRDEGAVFEVQLEAGNLRELRYRDEETHSRRARAQERLERLSERLSERDS